MSRAGGRRKASRGGLSDIIVGSALDIAEGVTADEEAECADDGPPDGPEEVASPAAAESK